MRTDMIVYFLSTAVIWHDQIENIDRYVDNMESS